MRQRIVVFLASGAYLGFAPVASGTVGTLAGVAVYPLFDGLRRAAWPGAYLVAFAALIGAAVWLAGEAERIFGESDSGKIAIDEVAGYVAATLFVPLSPVTATVAFVLFRAFDILKVWPASLFDRRGAGGWNVVMDDVVAGFYANLALRGMAWTAGVPL
jgi:phosphatidylglycerophosphatase A